MIYTASVECPSAKMAERVATTLISVFLRDPEVGAVRVNHDDRQPTITFPLAWSRVSDVASSIALFPGITIQFTPVTK